MKHLTAAGLMAMVAAGLVGYASLKLVTKVPPPGRGCLRSHVEVTASLSYTFDGNDQDGSSFSHLLDVHRFCDLPAISHDGGFYPP